MREIERIEEDHLKNIIKVKTEIQVPLHLMYLDLGQEPAQYQIRRFKLNIFNIFYNQKENSLLHQMLMAQQQHPVRNDWYSGVSNILKGWEINMSLEEITNMKRSILNNIT